MCSSYGLHEMNFFLYYLFQLWNQPEKDKLRPVKMCISAGKIYHLIIRFFFFM